MSERPHVSSYASITDTVIGFAHLLRQEGWTVVYRRRRTRWWLPEWHIDAGYLQICTESDLLHQQRGK